jgi:hypothetical protein
MEECHIKEHCMFFSITVQYVLKDLGLHASLDCSSIFNSLF